MRAYWVGMLLLCLLLMPRPGRAEPAPQEGVPVDVKAAPATSGQALSHINIQASFDPDLKKYGYLKGVGASIDRARETHDAEGLAMAALLLFKAEKDAARRSPDVSAMALLEEATRWAEQQKNPDALKLVAQLWSDPSFGPGDGTRGSALNAKAALLAAARQGKTRGAACRLHIRNLSSHTANIYADGQYLGTIDPYDSRYIYVENGATELYARATCHTVEWGPSNYRLGVDFTWRLTP